MTEDSPRQDSGYCECSKCDTRWHPGAMPPSYENAYEHAASSMSLNCPSCGAGRKVKRKVRLERWVNVYDTHNGYRATMGTVRERGKRFASEQVASVPIVIEFEVP